MYQLPELILYTLFITYNCVYFYCPHFIDEDIEAGVTCPRSHGKYVAEPRQSSFKHLPLPLSVIPLEQQAPQ